MMDSIITICFIYNAHMLSHTLHFFTITGLIAAILHFYHWFVKFFCPAAI